MVNNVCVCACVCVCVCVCVCLLSTDTVGLGEIDRNFSRGIQKQIEYIAQACAKNKDGKQSSTLLSPLWMGIQTTLTRYCAVESTISLS